MARTGSLRLSRTTGLVLLGVALISLALGQTAEAGVMGTVVIALLALAAIGLSRGVSGGGRLTSVLAALATAASLASRLVPGGFLSIEPPPSVVAALLVAASCAVVGAAWGSRRVAHVSLTVGGLTLLAIGVTALFVRLIGLFDLFAERGFGELSLLLCLGAVLFGGVMLILVWSDSPDPTAYPNSAPVAVAIAGLAGSFLLWRALVVREELQLDRLVGNEAAAAARAIERSVDGSGRVLHQFVLLHRDEQSSSALVQLLRDAPGIDFLALVDSVGNPMLTAPEGRDPLPIAATVPVRALGRPGSSQPPVAFLPIPNDTGRLVVHAASCVAGSCRGGVAGVVSASHLLSRATGERRGWDFSLGAVRQRDQGGHAVVTPVRFGELEWSLLTRPSTATIATSRSTVPEIALILGLATTALLAGLVRLGATAYRNARAVERMRISAAISRATDAVWEWDVAEGTLHRTAELWRHLGYDPVAMRSTADEWFSLVHPDDRAHVTDAFSNLGKDGTEAFEVEYRVATSHGDWHAVVDRGRVMETGSDGSPLRVMGITADVTQSRRAEQELREVEALSGMGRVAARVAHEINNPLAGIRSAFTLVKDAVPAGHPHHHYVGAIEREIERIAGVTRQLYEVYRPEAEAGSASLGTITGDAVALLQQVNRASNVEIDVSLDGVPPVVPVSGALLRQIVYNLVQNAVDASPVGGVVDILGRIDRGELVIAVDDQGPGVPTELRQRIFEPFFTTKSSEVRTSGMGLGLSMVARSVAAANGSISVDMSPSGGARFEVRLPLSREGATR
ncbi:MAG TPA: ATP-binding protein [Gemmatimonadales bacterium]|nr:ATP-binding protein [Gemmatimonadales bacterium]